MSILDELAEHARYRVSRAKERKTAEQIRKEAYILPKGDLFFEEALRKPGMSFICECKKASPSKGIIAEDFPYLDIAREYEDAGADAISVLTEPKWFLGSEDYLKQISENVCLPLLRKDFTVDEYMIYEAKLLGASAVLLIVAILDKEDIEKYLKICDELALSALVECHDEAEIDTALSAGARILGINNRNLKDFSVDTSLCGRLRDRVPKEICLVSESGIKERADVAALESAGVDAVLVGETLMRAFNKREMLRSLRG